MTEGSTNHGQCLTDDSLTDYLEGVLDPALKAANEAHLVGCDDCRVKLAFFMRLLKDDMQPEEVIAIRSIQEEWTRSRNDRRLPARRRGGSGSWKKASGGLAAAILIAVGTRVALDYKSEPRNANEVIHLLLAENRPFEARISDQPHLPYAATRGPSDSPNSYNLLAGQMNRLSATAYEMGQFDLLQKDFSNAIKYLELASRETSAADVHNDLGVAYMESGMDANQSKAVAEFRRALAARPDFLPAAFNLAVLYERMGKNDQAELQWGEYLRIESDQGWKDEARARMEGMTH